MVIAVPDAPLVAVLVLVAATDVIWLGSGWLEASADRLSTHYGLPAVVQGRVVVATGSSFPELASVVLTTLSGSFAMGVGAIVGSAIFNVFVIPAASRLATDGPVDADRAIVYKDAKFHTAELTLVNADAHNRWQKCSTVHANRNR